MERTAQLIKRFSQVAIGCSFLSLVGCSGSLPELPTATVHPSMTQNINEYSYLIGPGDSLEIYVWGNAEVSGSYTVRPDGMISTSLVDDVQASGRTSTELARELETKLSEYLREPIVSVFLRGFVGPFSEQVRVIGEASEPQAISYSENMTLLDVMIQVGGLTDYADGDDARLIRVVNGQQRQFSLKIDSLITNGIIQANVDILPGDIIIIPEAWY